MKIYLGAEREKRNMDILLPVRKLNEKPKRQSRMMMSKAAPGNYTSRGKEGMGKTYRVFGFGELGVRLVGVFQFLKQRERTGGRDILDVVVFYLSGVADDQVFAMAKLPSA